jgi:hypothetical protein
MVYLDQQAPAEIIQRLDYLGQNNMINIPYLQTWNMNTHSVAGMMQALMPIVTA